MSRVPLVVGNWKMNTSRDEAVSLAREVVSGAPSGVDVAICPPFPWLLPVADAVSSSDVAVGAQNCWTEQSGAYTGEVAPAMLRGICRYVIVGHSERRQLLGESDDLVARKGTAALEADLLPIICVGESLETRRAGEAAAFVQAQVEHALDQRSRDELSRCTIAYEPIWAIGTGVAAEPADAEEMAGTIRATVRRVASDLADSMRVLYGGSVTAANAADVLGGPNVDGALVGGASLKSEAFLAILRAARR